MAELRAVIQETITAFVQNNTTAVKAKDVSLLSSVLSADCVKMYRPLSFVNKYPQFFKAQITNAEYEAQMQMELQTMSDVVQNVTRTVIDAHQRVANVWIEKTVHTVNGSTSSVEVILSLDLKLESPLKLTTFIRLYMTWSSQKMGNRSLSTLSSWTPMRASRCWSKCSVSMVLSDQPCYTSCLGFIRWKEAVALGTSGLQQSLGIPKYLYCGNLKSATMSHHQILSVYHMHVA